MPPFRKATDFTLLAALVLVSCMDRPSPTEPARGGPPPTVSQASMIEGRLVAIDPAFFVAAGSAAERRDGRFRFRTASDAPVIEPGTYIIGEAEQPYLRRVVSAHRSGQDVSLETVEAYWPEILRTGTYGYTVSMGPPHDPSGSDGTDGIPIEIGDGAPTDVFIDFCTGQGLEEAPDAVRNFQICNRPNDGLCKEVSAANWDIEVCGNITRLQLVGVVSLDGDFDLTYSIDAGGFVPPVLPIYSPCSTHPVACGYTGFCIVGTSVVVQVIPLRTQTCTLVRAGSPARIDPPSVRNAGLDGEMKVSGELSLIVEAAAMASIDIPIPKAGYSKKFFNKGKTSSDSVATGEISVGAFINVTLRAAGFGATLTGTTDQHHEFFFGWSEVKGWDSGLDTRKFEGDLDLTFDKPDTISVRVGARRKIEFEAPIIPGLPGPLARLGGKVALGAGYDQPWDQVTWSRPPAHNWKYDVDRGVAVQAEAKLELPFGFSKLTGIKLDQEFDRDFLVRDHADYFGRGDVLAVVLPPTAGSDPDGYTLTLARTSGTAEPAHSDPLTTSLPGSGGTQRFSQLVPEFDELCVKLYAPFSFFTGNASYLNCDLAAEPHTLSVTGLSPNCAVVGANPRDIALVPDATVTDTIRITCKAPSDSAFANVRATITRTGPGTDGDGYWIEIDGVPAGVVGDNSSVVLGGLSSGTLNIALTDVAPNCSTVGATTATADVAAGDTADVGFDVHCMDASQTGTVHIDVTTAGDSLDADGYIILLDGNPMDSVSLNGTITLGGIMPGLHTVELGSVASQCTVDAGATRTVDFQAGVTINESFDVTCPGAEPVGEIWVDVNTTGSASDATFTVRAGDAEASIDPDGHVLFQGVPEGRVSVRLEDLPRDCAVHEANPANVMVVRSTRADVTFTVDCGRPTTVHSLAGSIGVTAVQRSGSGTFTAAIPAAAHAAQMCWNNALQNARGPVLASGIFSQRFQNCFTTLGLKDEVLQLGIDGAFFGTVTWTRTLSLDTGNTGGIHGSWTMDVTWNGESGTFSGYAAGRVDNGSLELVVAARGAGPFQGMSVELTIRGALEGPFTYSAVMVPDVW